MKLKIKPEDKILDVRPIFERGGRPCEEIDKGVAALKPEQRLVLLAPFEPVPLYSKLAISGLGHSATELADGSWRIEFDTNTPISPIQHKSDHLCQGTTPS